MVRLIQALCIILVSLGSASATDIHVPGDYATIQEAIDAAVDGDSVIVEPGTYKENLIFLDKQIAVRSSQGAEKTAINGMKVASVVSFNHCGTENTLLEGFTLRNGKGNEISNKTYGGGIYLGERCQPVLRSLIIDANQAKYGGAVYGKEACPTFEHCIISNNLGFTYGAGFYCTHASDMKLIHCTITENETENQGGGIWCSDSEPLILNCIISQNKARRGAGIYSSYGEHQPVVVNTNIVMNHASNSASGFYCDSGAIITNSILWNFTSSGMDEIFYGNHGDLQITYSVIKGGWPGAGNIEAQPEFLFPYNNDFHILSTSPCIDAGSDELVYLLEYDIDGDPRIINGRIDIGVDEFSTPHGSPGEYYVPDDYPGIQDAIDASYPGDVIIVRPGTYVGNLNFKGQPITLKSSDGPGQTVIDGEGEFIENRPVVVFSYLEKSDSVLQGFTLTNGSGCLESGNNQARGGGIYCYKAAPLLVDNIIEHNKAYHGGGIYSSEGLDLITGCVLRENHATRGGGICLYGGGTIENCTITGNLSGGGIYIGTSSPVTIRNNLIENNQGGAGITCYWHAKITIENNSILNNVNSGDGGGICITGDRINTIRNNKIIGNYALNGGGIHSTCKQLHITENIIACNRVEGQGGGIKCTKGGVISNNVICYNTAEMTPSSQYGIGGGVLVENGDAVRIINSLIYKNSAARYGGGLYIYGGADLYFSHLTMVGNSATEGSGIYASGQAQMSITNSIIRNEGANEIYSESTSPAVANSNVKGGWPGVSIIDADPLFVDESENDFHLLYDSPCLNTGSNGHTAGDTDFEGDPRIAYDMADMGADEFHPHLYYKGTSAPCSRVDIRVVGLPDTASVGIFVGSGVLDPPLPTAWGLFYLQSPYFLYKLPAIPSNGVLSFNVMIPVSIPAPSTLPLQAIIGEGEDALSNLCIMEIKE